MALDVKAVGLRIRAFREQLPEPMDMVSASTGIPSSRLSDIETGSASPTGDEILILADHFRCDFKSLLAGETAGSFESLNVLFRAHSTDLSVDDRRAIREFLYLCETEQFLTERLSRKVQSFTFQPRGDYFKSQAMDAAAALRNALSYTDNRAIPRDVYAEFRKIGIHLFRRKLENSNISGLFIQHPQAGACALVNLDEDMYRQRFSAAHETAHAIFDFKDEPSVSYFRLQKPELVEVRANNFASSFLMPPGFLANLPDPEKWSDGDALHWANSLRVSCQALGIALSGAGLIDEAKSRHFQGLRVSPESKIDPELPPSLSETQRARKRDLLARGLSDHYVGLCFDAYTEQHISRGRLAEALLSSQAELPILAALYGRKTGGI